VHILAGTNDVAGNTGPTTLQAIKNNIMAMVEMAQSHHIAVVLGSILPAGKFGWRPSITPVESIRALNEWLKAYAVEHKLSYADYYSAMKDDQSALKSNLGDDGVHPNAQGYALMRPIAQKAVTQALAAR
jgi:lysophospholipase L1-like esterase